MSSARALSALEGHSAAALVTADDRCRDAQPSKLDDDIVPIAAARASVRRSLRTSRRPARYQVGGIARLPSAVADRYPWSLADVRPTHRPGARWPIEIAEW